MAFIEKEQMIANEYIAKTRAYLDYLEEHIENIRLAFQEVSKACDGMMWVGDDVTWWGLRGDVCNHDVSKFSKEEFTQYRAKFFTLDADQDVNKDFDKAWEHHKEANHHHWETVDDEEFGHIGTMEKNVVHMIVDWTAMGYKFGDTAQEYYEANKDSIAIEPKLIPFMYQVFNKIKEVK